MKKYSKTHFVTDYKPGSDAVVELRNGKIADVDKGCFLKEGTTLVIRNGKIISMPDLPEKPGDLTPDFSIDLQGKTVLPGLFNVHCHVHMLSPVLLAGLKDIKLAKKHSQSQLIHNMNECLAHGITNIRDAMTNNLQVSRDLKKKISQKEIAGPRITQAVCVTQPDGYMSQKSGVILRTLKSMLGLPAIDFDDQDAGILVFPLDATEQQVRDAVNRAIDERGAEVIKIPEQRTNMSTFKEDLKIMTIKQFQALTDQARKRGLKSTIHQVMVETFRRGIEGGISSFAHMARDGKLTDDDVENFIKADCIVEPTLSVGYDLSWKVNGDELHDHPNMNLLSQYRENTYTFSDLADEYYVPELRDSIKESYNKFVNNKFKMLGLINLTKMIQNYSSIIYPGTENFRKLFTSGARMALANDGGVPPCTPAMMGPELALFDLLLNGGEEKIFSGADAVKIATINSAYSMGLEETFGSIEIGKTADLAIVDGNPFEDFNVVGSRVAALFMEGKLVIDNCGLDEKI